MNPNGQATKLAAVEGVFTATEIPFPEPHNQLVDTQGNPVHTRMSLMARLDQKLTEKSGLSNGTVVLIPIVCAAIMVVFYWGGSLIGVARDDQQKKLEIQQLQNDVNSLKQDTKEIKTTLQAMEIKSAYALGAGTAHENEKPKTKEKK